MEPLVYVEIKLGDLIEGYQSASSVTLKFSPNRTDYDTLYNELVAQLEAAENGTIEELPSRITLNYHYSRIVLNIIERLKMETYGMQ